jgi:hypothetical protein
MAGSVKGAAGKTLPAPDWMAHLMNPLRCFRKTRSWSTVAPWKMPATPSTMIPTDARFSSRIVTGLSARSQTLLFQDTVGRTSLQLS